MGQIWSGAEEIRETRYPSQRYEAWLKKTFASFPKEAKRLGSEKWRHIRKWHLAERKLWRAMRCWASLRGEDGWMKGAKEVFDAYESARTAYAAAVEAHWPCCHVATRELRKTCSGKSMELLTKHPGSFPARH